jgi:hypothetical protein
MNKRGDSANLALRNRPVSAIFRHDLSLAFRFTLETKPGYLARVAETLKDFGSGSDRNSEFFGDSPASVAAVSLYRAARIYRVYMCSKRLLFAT